MSCHSVGILLLNISSEVNIEVKQAFQQEILAIVILLHYSYYKKLYKLLLEQI